MHFINTLFTVKSQTLSATGGNFLLALNAAHPIYRGHFPDNPITPGVCSLEIITQLAAAHYSGLEKPVEVESIKYLGFVNPLQTPEVAVEISISNLGGGDWRLRGTLSADQKPAVKMVAKYQVTSPTVNLKYHD